MSSEVGGYPGVSPLQRSPTALPATCTRKEAQDGTPWFHTWEIQLGILSPLHFQKEPMFPVSHWRMRAEMPSYNLHKPRKQSCPRCGLRGSGRFLLNTEPIHVSVRVALRTNWRLDSLSDTQSLRPGAPGGIPPRFLTEGVPKEAWITSGWVQGRPSAWLSVIPPLGWWQHRLSSLRPSFPSNQQ